MLALLVALLCRCVRLIRQVLRCCPRPYRRCRVPKPYVYRRRRKPRWVRQEIIRLKALMRESGTCRAIAISFNRRFAMRRQMTVGRTFVSEIIRTHRYEIEVERRRIKTAKPKAVRTDNEAVFISKMFRLALFLLGIRHQRTEPGCPWQNGRVERFFLTLKEKLDQLAIDSSAALEHALVEFRFFYNHVRPHQNLYGRTPAEAWAGVDPFTTRITEEHWFEAWDGLLRGYYLRR